MEKTPSYTIPNAREDLIELLIGLNLIPADPDKISRTREDLIINTLLDYIYEKIQDAKSKEVKINTYV